MMNDRSNGGQFRPSIRNRKPVVKPKTVEVTPPSNVISCVGATASISWSSGSYNGVYSSGLFDLVLDGVVMGWRLDSGMLTEAINSDPRTQGKIQAGGYGDWEYLIESADYDNPHRIELIGYRDGDSNPMIVSGKRFEDNPTVTIYSSAASSAVHGQGDFAWVHNGDGTTIRLTACLATLAPV